MFKAASAIIAFSAILLTGCGDETNGSTADTSTTQPSSTEDSASKNGYEIYASLDTLEITEGGSKDIYVFLRHNDTNMVISDDEYSVTTTESGSNVVLTSVYKYEDALNLTMDSQPVSADTNVEIKVTFFATDSRPHLEKTIKVTVLERGDPKSVQEAEILKNRGHQYFQLPEIVKVHKLYLDLAFMNGDIDKHFVQAEIEKMNNAISGNDYPMSNFYYVIDGYTKEYSYYGDKYETHRSDLESEATGYLFYAEAPLAILNDSIRLSGQEGRLVKFPSTLTQDLDAMVNSNSIFEGNASMGKYQADTWVFTGDYEFMNEIMSAEVQ